MKRLLYTLFGIMKFVLPIFYIAGAVLIWLVFSRTNPDGLANIWLVIYTFPIVAIGTYVLNLDFPYVPGDYYDAHALYFWPSVVILAVFLYALFSVLQEIIQPRRSKPSDGRR